MYHKILIVGHLGRDPEMRYMPNGKPVTNFSVASTRKWNNQDGGQGEETIWVRVSAFGRMAEVCNEYLAKGRLVLVEGRLRPDPETGGPRVYQKNDGGSGAAYEIVAETVKFLGGRGNGGEGASEPAPSDEGDGDSIPF
jgi:single-strand DNA-binding protein